jgi:hypothetical protein
MSSSDWISFGSTLVACLALAVSLFALREQKRKDQYDAGQDLADQINAINDELAKLSPASPSDRPMDLVANASNANAALQTLVLRVVDLIGSQRLRPDWFQSAVLAMAFIEIGDVAGANTYTGEALGLARESVKRGGASALPPRALVLSLRMRATFCFSRGLHGDADAARDLFDEARARVKANEATQGPYMTASELIELNMREASFEVSLGNTGNAVHRISDAVAQWDALDAPLPRRTLGTLIDSVARNQTIVRPDVLLPSEFRDAMQAMQQTADSAGTYGYLRSEAVPSTSG